MHKDAEDQAKPIDPVTLRIWNLRHGIVQVLDLSDPDRHFPFGVQGIKCGQVRAAPVDGDRLRFSIVPDRLFEVSVFM